MVGDQVVEIVKVVERLIHRIGLHVELTKHYLIIGDDMSGVCLRIQNVQHGIGDGLFVIWLSRGRGLLKLCGLGATVGTLGVFRIPRGETARMKGMATGGLCRARGLLTRGRGMIHNLFVAHRAINRFGHVIQSAGEKMVFNFQSGGGLLLVNVRPILLRSRTIAATEDYSEPNEAQNDARLLTL